MFSKERLVDRLVKKKRQARLAAFLAATLAGALVLPFAGGAQEAVPVTAFVGQTHVHGLVVDFRDPTYLFIATHHGLFRAGPDGMAQQVSIVQDLMSLASDPANPDVLYASGHPAGGGNLGFLVSEDGGETWVQRSAGVSGPADFHQLAVSPVDPLTIYGVFGGLQVSSDAGATWRVAGRQLPPRTVDIATSAVGAERIFAAAEGGLFVSNDAGANWRALIRNAPVSLVEVAPDGSVYAFVGGQGLLRAPSEESDFVSIGSNWVEPFLFHLAIDPNDPNRVYAATATARVVVSTDGGRNWVTLGY